jgi:polar amino acid transport system substrate-binding protein
VHEDVVTDYLAPDGVLRVAINLGNPVLAHGTPGDPGGVTVDLAREIAARLGVAVQFNCFDAARHSLAATVAGETNLCFLAVEPAREDDISFTAPYAVIEGAFAVPRGSQITTVADVDRPGVRVGVKRGSAYDLYLTRTLTRASVVPGADGVDAFRAGALEVAAGLRAPIAAFVAGNSDVRMIDEPFMQIQQALGTRRDAPVATGRFLNEVVEHLKRSGFIASALQRAGQPSATVAPAASSA